MILSRFHRDVRFKPTQGKIPRFLSDLFSSQNSLNKFYAKMHRNVQCEQCKDKIIREFKLPYLTLID